MSRIEPPSTQRPSKNSARLTAVYDREPHELLRAAERAVERLPRWTLSGRKDAGLQAVRTTALLRFKDDITAGAKPGNTPGRSRITLASTSRIGKGDLGQNPRNLREFLETLEAELE